jgi:hypothetical protein
VWTNGKKRIFHTFSLLVEIEGHFTHEFVTSVYETRDSGMLTEAADHLVLKGIVSWEIDGIFKILSYSLDGRQLPVDILFILILCFHILILILMLARCRYKLRQLFRKRWHSLDKSAIAGQQSILIEPHILDNTHAFFTGTYLTKLHLFIPGSNRLWDNIQLNPHNLSKLRQLFRKSWRSLDLHRANININIKIW